MKKTAVVAVFVFVAGCGVEFTAVHRYAVEPDRITKKPFEASCNKDGTRCTTFFGGIGICVAGRCYVEIPCESHSDCSPVNITSCNDGVCVKNARVR